MDEIVRTGANEVLRQRTFPSRFIPSLCSSLTSFFLHLESDIDIFPGKQRSSLAKWFCSAPSTSTVNALQRRWRECRSDPFGIQNVAARCLQVQRSSSWRSLKERRPSSIKTRTLSVDELHRKKKSPFLRRSDGKRNVLLCRRSFVSLRQSLRRRSFVFITAGQEQQRPVRLASIVSPRLWLTTTSCRRPLLHERRRISSSRRRILVGTRTVGAEIPATPKRASQHAEHGIVRVLIAIANGYPILTPPRSPRRSPDVRRFTSNLVRFTEPINSSPVAPTRTFAQCRRTILLPLRLRIPPESNER